MNFAMRIMCKLTRLPHQGPRTEQRKMKKAPSREVRQGTGNKEQKRGQSRRLESPEEGSRIHSRYENPRWRENRVSVRETYCGRRTCVSLSPHLCTPLLAYIADKLVEVAGRSYHHLERKRFRVF